MAANQDLFAAIVEADASQRLLMNEDPNVNENEEANAYLNEEPNVNVNEDANANVNEDENSDAESAIGGPAVIDPPTLFGLMIKLHDESRIHRLIKESFLSGLGDSAARINVVSIYRNGFHSIETKARLEAFQLFEDAVKRKNGGNNGSANVKYAWYASTKTEIKMILEHGFFQRRNNELFGQGVHLAPDNCSLESVRRSVADRDGLRYMMLCRVILGRSELVEIGSNQHCPSSIDFDSGVDRLASPKTYIIWSPHMGTHILPEFVLSFEAPDNLQELVRVVPPPSRRPTSPWLPRRILLAALSDLLTSSQMHTILRLYREQKEGRISLFELVQQIRRIIGDELLNNIIKAYRHRDPI